MWRGVALAVCLAACSGQVTGANSPDASGTAEDASGPAAMTCDPAAGGHAGVPMPVLVRSLVSGSDEAWLGAPAVADLDGDGVREIVVPRENRVVAWEPGGAVKWQVTLLGSRIWAPPVVGNFTGDAKLEVVVAARGRVYMIDAAGNVLAPFPVMWRDEIRAIAAGDLDHDGKLEIVTVTTSDLKVGDQVDIIQVFRGDGTVQPGFPPNTTGTSGCDAFCFVHGGFDQTLAIGPIDDDADLDIFVPQDNAYMSWHHGNGVAFDAPPGFFSRRAKVNGIRWMLDYALARQGFGDDEDLQAHFTNSAPAIVDLDGDGHNDLVVLGSVQNVAQTDREKGIVVFVANRDGTRPPAWVVPFSAPTFLAGLEDPGETNIVAITQEIAVADLDANVAGRDLVFPGFDGRIHLVGADRQERWSYPYTTSPDVLTSGVVIADLTRDGVPEIVFTTYSTKPNLSALVILDASGHLQRSLPLPGRGAMPVPTIADIDQDGTLEILVSLKDVDGGPPANRAVLVYNVPDSATNCLPWPTARHDLLRSGYVP